MWIRPRIFSASCGGGYLTLDLVELRGGDTSSGGAWRDHEPKYQKTHSPEIVSTISSEFPVGVPPAGPALRRRLVDGDPRLSWHRGSRRGHDGGLGARSLVLAPDLGEQGVHGLLGHSGAQLCPGDSCGVGLGLENGGKVDQSKELTCFLVSALPT